jgi:hypothetical protein
VWGVFEF